MPINFDDFFENEASERLILIEWIQIGNVKIKFNFAGMASSAIIIMKN